MNADLLEAFRRSHDDPAADEARMAVLVARLLDPELDPDALHTRLRDLAAACPTHETAWGYLGAAGFAGNTEDYEALDNSNLARVLETRRGIPISLGVVLIHVARGSGRIAAGINFPGHFLVQIDDALVDPFVMRTVQPTALIERLPAGARPADPAALFVAASPLAVGLRMLNNVKLGYSRHAVWHEALTVLDAQLALAPEQPVFYLEQGDLWRRLGSIAAARDSWDRALEAASAAGDSAGLEQAVRQRLDEIGGSSDVVH